MLCYKLFDGERSDNKYYKIDKFLCGFLTLLLYEYYIRGELIF